MTSHSNSNNDITVNSLPVATETEYHQIIEYCKDGNIKALEALFNTYNCINLLNTLYVTSVYLGPPLIWAVKGGNDSIVQLMLDKGANINVQDDAYGETALINACYNGREAIVQLLLNRGVDVNMSDVEGWTPLICASDKGHSSVIKLLLDNGADMNIKDAYGKTALMHASKYGFIDTIKLLVEHGADITLQDEEGNTVYDMTNRHDIKNYLQEEATRIRSSQGLK